MDNRDVCKSKIQYISYTMALEVMEYDQIGNSYIYRCNVCKKYHLSHTDEKRRKPRKNKFQKKTDKIMKSKRKK